MCCNQVENKKKKRFSQKGCHLDKHAGKQEVYDGRVAVSMSAS